VAVVFVGRGRQVSREAILQQREESKRKPFLPPSFFADFAAGVVIER